MTNEPLIASRATEDAPRPAPRPDTVAVPHPLAWLVVIFLVALALRWRHLEAPLELDEFGPLYAIAERPGLPAGYTATAAYPLVPVPTWEAMRERSILPYGIVHPFPVYHTLLYLQGRWLPLAEWSLRLPSLLAGLGCVVGVYFLCRRALGERVALAAALLAAADPIQVAVSTLARPYALGNLACVVSFLALVALLRTRRRGAEPWLAIGYGLAVAFMAYMNSLYLLVGAAQVPLVAYGLLGPGSPPLARDRCRKLALWLAGGALAAVLFAPLLGYLRQIQQFTDTHRDYLNLVLLGGSPFTIVLLHNYGFLFCLIALSLASLVLYLRADEAGMPRPDPVADPLVLWLARFWFFLPQLVAVGFMYGTRDPVFLSRYLGYTTLGAAILLAYGAARHHSNRVFIALTCLMVALLVWWADRPAGTGFNVRSLADARLVTEQLDYLDEHRLWRKGDVVLFRPAFLESDFLPHQLPEATRRHVEGVLVAPLTTLYTTRTSKPFVRLSLSQRCGTQSTLWAGHLYDPAPLYNADLARRLRRNQRYWMCSYEWERPTFLACFLPWLADAVGWDLTVYRNRPAPDNWFTVYTSSGPDDYTAGLSDGKLTDFALLFLIRKQKPEGIFTVGALGAAALPGAMLTVPVWLTSQAQTPRETAWPDAPPGD